jgi:NadR type nicotinamide-nucleotide adenylyltransferase
MAKTVVRKIGVLGAESTGKTWLCETLAAYFKTSWVPEYAREYFNDSDIYNYTLNDLVKIAVRQLAMEEKSLTNAHQFLFCDTTLITLKIWAELEFDTVPAFITDNLYNSKYDHFLITNNELDWEEDNLRQNKFSRDLILEMNINEVKKTGIPFSIITGSKKERLTNAVNILTGIQ